VKVILELFYSIKDIGEFIKTLHLLHPYLLPNGIAASESPELKSGKATQGKMK